MKSEVVVGPTNRSFGFVFVGFFLVVGAVGYYKGRELFWIWPCLSAVVLLITLTVPNALTPLNRAWTKFGLVLHKITSPIILGIMFFVVVTPFALVMRLFGKQFLSLKLERNAKSYWITRADRNAQSMKYPF